jgi:hypothetical protein
MIIIPTYKQMPIVVTEMMKQAMNMTLHFHLTGGGACCWYGDPGIGKTATAHHMRQTLEEGFNVNAKNPNAFQAMHFECGPIGPSVNAMKAGIRVLYQIMTRSSLPSGIYSGASLEELAIMVIDEAKKRRIQMFFVDEAGLMSADAVRGMMFVCDIAKRMNWHLTMVLIGDNDLPKKIISVPAVERRITGWIHFKQYDFDGTCQILRVLHPHFESLNYEVAEDQEKLELMHEVCEGLPARIVHFLNHLDYHLKISPCSIDLRFLRTIHLLMKQDKQGWIPKSKANNI